MNSLGPFAPQRFLLPAFSVLWLVLLAVSWFHAPTYALDAQMKIGKQGRTLVIESPGPDLARAGVKPGDAIDVPRLSFADNTRLLYAGAPRGMLFELPVRGVSGDRIVSARATRVFPAPKAATPLKFWTEDVPLALSLVLAAFLGYRRPGIMIAALILFIGGGGINWNRVAAAVTSWPDWLLSLTCKPLALVCTIFPVLVLASFAIRLPGDEPSPEKRRVIRIVDSVVILGFVVEGMPYSATLSAIYLVFSALLVIAAAMLSLRYARPVDRARVAVVFAAVMIGGVGYAADMLVAIF
ncbi:MAG TPA: hypothetical protein VFL13_07795, partial [Candidatus Baltobacteraceae bacterium]|nr:hypothetical protein [Candidatus Baltobacteraceae bacterium]